MKPVLGFAEGGLEKLIFETQVGPRGTIADIIARKAARKGVGSLMHKDETKPEEFNPALGKLAFCSMLAKLAVLDKEAPFKSEAQRRKFYAMESRGEISKKTLNEWESETPDKKLPERVEKKEAASEEKLAILAAAAKGGAFMAKSFFLPTTLGQTATGVGMWGAGAAVRGAKKSPVTQQISQIAARDLIEMTKQALVVKKKLLSKDGALLSAVSAKPSASKEPSTAKGDWLRRSSTGTQKLNVAASTQEGKQMAGASSTERVGGPGAGPHIQRGF
jgi:hypothetical protein